MRVSVAAIGAVTFGSSVVTAQSPPLNIVGIPVIKELADIEGQWKFDACHKVDSAVDGLIWPCASQLRTRVKLCPKSAATAEERTAQRDCLCGAGSSFLADAVACSECKVQNGLQPATQRAHWIQYYKEVGDKYCRPEAVPLSFEDFTAELGNRTSVPEGGRNLNLHNGVADPKIYYESAKLEVPKQQGAGKFTPAAAQAGRNETAAVAVPDPLAGQVKVPVFIAVENLPTVNETETVSTSTPFRNMTGPTSTFLTITTTSSSTSTSTVLPATTVAPAPGTVSGPVEEHTIVVDGQRCVVLIMWIIVDCSPKTDAGGNFAIDFENAGIDKTEPIMKLENGAQFDKVKDAMADAGKDEKLTEQAKERVGTVAPVVAAPGNNKELLPAKQSTGGSNVAAPEEIVCPEGTELVEVPSGGSEAGASVPADAVKPVTGNPSKNSGNPAQNSGNPAQNSGNPAQNSGNPSQNSAKPAQNSAKPAQNSAKPAQNSGNPAQNSGSHPVSSVGQPDTEVCECPPASAVAPATPDATEICTKKVKTETDCRALSGDDVRKCLCSEDGFADRRFFDEAIICSRRSADPRQGEFEAQIFFEVKARYCQHKQFGNDFGAAYASVEGEWREARAPSANLS